MTSTKNHGYYGGKVDVNRMAQHGSELPFESLIWLLKLTLFWVSFEHEFIFQASTKPHNPSYLFQLKIPC